MEPFKSDGGESGEEEAVLTFEEEPGDLALIFLAAVTILALVALAGCSVTLIRLDYCPKDEAKPASVNCELFRSPTIRRNGKVI